MVNPFLKRFFTEQPGWLVAGLIAAVNGLSYSGTIRQADALNISLGIVILGAIIYYSAYNTRRRQKTLDTLRYAVEYYIDITKAEDEASAINIMNVILTPAIGVRNPVREATVNLTHVIHNILSEYLRERIISIARAGGGAVTEERIRELEDRVLNTVRWYHNHVVTTMMEPSFFVHIRQNLVAEPLFAKFRMKYNKAIDNFESARKTANSECNLTLDSNLDPFRIPS